MRFSDNLRRRPYPTVSVCPQTQSGREVPARWTQSAHSSDANWTQDGCKMPASRTQSGRKIDASWTRFLISYFLAVLYLLVVISEKMFAFYVFPDKNQKPLRMCRLQITTQAVAIVSLISGDVNYRVGAVGSIQDS